MANKAKCKTLDKILEERKATKRRQVELENQMFKLESAYLELAGGSPITKSIEYYLNNRVEKKKTVVDDSARIFATEYPKQKEPTI